MIGRRAFGGLAAGAAGAALLPVRIDAATQQDVDRLSFQVIRNGSAIGTHTVRFERQGRVLLAHIDCRLRVGLGPITLFRYHHQGVERWQDGAFASLETQTDDDGEALTVSARRVASGIEIRTRDGGLHVVSAAALPLTHWNRACMSAGLFNPQDGKMLPESASLKGTDTVKLADGSQVRATHYAMTGKAPIDDWYDMQGTWTALKAQVKDGSTLQYVRTA